MRRPRPTGESQMPMTRSPRFRDMASVTSPAGLVKLIVQASGASRAMLRARSRATGTVRSPYAMPPAPTVSWPSTPSSRATRSSAARLSQAADPDGGEDEVGAAQRLVQLCGGDDGGRVRDAPALLGQNAGDGGEPVGVGVVQGDPGDAAFGVVAEEGPVHEGHPEPATAKNCQLHAARWYGQAPRARVGRARRAARRARRGGPGAVGVIRGRRGGGTALPGRRGVGRWPWVSGRSTSG